jgi:MFS family permease
MKLSLGSVGRDVRLLTVAFLFIFLGYDGVQQYVTTFFSDAGMVEIGFYSLILVYLSFMLSGPVSAVIVSRYGARNCMITASVFYSLFILSLLTKSAVLVYLASVLIGFSAALLWTGQGSYLIRASREEFYGANAGFFNSLRILGSAIGVLSLGFLISFLPLDLPFLVFSVFPVIGLLIMFWLRDLRKEQKASQFRLVRKSITSVTALRLSLIFFSFMFVFGLVIGIIPLEIKRTLGVSYTGFLVSSFYAMPILFSYFFGRLSDIRGRKWMLVLSYIILLAGLALMYFSEHMLFLVSGILLLALNYSIMRTIGSALVGDVSTKDNLEFLAALFWVFQNIGTTSALVLSIVFQTKMLFMVSLAIIAVSLAIVLPLFRLDLKEIRLRISREVSLFPA